MKMRSPAFSGPTEPGRRGRVEARADAGAVFRLVLEDALAARFAAWPAIGLVFVLAFAGPTAAASDAEALAAAFLSHPAVSHPALSPDGLRVAAISAHADVDRIVVLPVDGSGEAREVLQERRDDRGFDASRTIGMLGWAGDDVLVYAIETPLRSPEGGVARLMNRRERVLTPRQRGIGMFARKTRLHSTSLDGRSRYLGLRWQDGPASQYQHDVIDFLPDDPNHVLLAFEGKAVRVDVRNGGRLTIVRDLDRASTWAADHAGHVRAGLSTRGFDRREALHARISERDPWQKLVDRDPSAPGGLRFAGFSPDPTKLFVFADDEAEHASLHEYDLVKHALARRVEPEATKGREIRGLLQSERDDRLLAVEYCEARCARAIVDPTFERAWRKIEARFPKQAIGLVGRSRAEDRWLLEVSTDVAPPVLWLAEPESGRFERIAPAHPGLANRALAPMETLRYRARDGITIEASWTRPLGGTGPVPVVVLPHDGPASRAGWGFDPVVQYFAARGFGVFQPNYRGSKGYGRAFEQAGRGARGGVMLRDVIDGVRALVGSGRAARGRVGIYGVGVGGYLALEALVEAPELFAAGASYGAPTDLKRLLSDARRYLGRGNADDWIVLPGSGVDPGATTGSPVDGVDRIRVPLLIGHGSEDPRHPAKHADALIRALRRAGKPFEAIRYEGATERFLDDRQQIDFHRRLADFFERHLDGRGKLAENRSQASDRATRSLP